MPFAANFYKKRFTKIIIGIIPVRIHVFFRQCSLLSCICIHESQFRSLQSLFVSHFILLCVITLESLLVANYEWNCPIIKLLFGKWMNNEHFWKKIFIVQSSESRNTQTLINERWNEIHSFFQPFLILSTLESAFKLQLNFYPFTGFILLLNVYACFNIDFCLFST